jgi:hypothetical protein
MKQADSSGGTSNVGVVRTLIALGCIVVGAWLAAYAWLPAIVQLPLPAIIASWTIPLGVVLAVVGLLVLLLRRAPQKPTFGDGPLLSTLKEAGFKIGPVPNGWQADGAWKGVPLKIRKSTGHEAGRFGRPWTIVVTLPGQPAEPWAFMPEEGLIVEQRDNSFTVAMADLSRPERMHRLGERLNQLLGQRS